MAALRSARFAAAFFWAASLNAQPAAPVTTASGRITGKDLGDVQSWLGIPYAAPPVGDLRWKAPRPPASWEGVRAMDRYGSICMQPPRLAVGQPTAMSEDCLTLNVWAPKRASKAPVMFWIHGGAFVEGSGALAVYAGTSLARQGVVVVTINYRLGDFGFFAYPELSRESAPEPAANFGLMDQIAALRWVHKNIAAFGGDPGNVTIFGESAGAMSVNVLMMSPPARGLFQRAIAESGGGRVRILNVADLERSGVRKGQQWGAADLKALRGLSADTIQKGQGPLSLAAYGPVADGKYVPAAPGTAFSEGKQAAVPFLLGANSFEASLMSLFGIGNDEILGRAVSRSDRVRELYGDDPQKAAQDLFTDALFLGPARHLATQMEKVHQPAYLYFFSYVAERRRSQARGAAHGSEIPFVFDQFPRAIAFLATPEDRRMADTMSAMWVQFARTGNPNRPGLPEWPAYTVAGDRLLEFGTSIAVRQHFRAERLDLLDLRQ